MLLRHLSPVSRTALREDLIRHVGDGGHAGIVFSQEPFGVEAMLCCLERVTRSVIIRWKLHEIGRLSPGASDSGWGNAVKRGPGEGCLWKLRDATERQDKLCGVTILVRVHCSCVAQTGLVHWAGCQGADLHLGLGKGPLCFMTAIATALLHLKYPKQQQLTKCWWLCFPIPREPATDVIVCARKIRAVSRSLDYQFPGSAIESACGLHVPRTMTFSTHFFHVPAPVSRVTLAQLTAECKQGSLPYIRFEIVNLPRGTD